MRKNLVIAAALLLGSLRREQVHILRQDDGRTVVDTPDEHPQGMGVTGLLKSDLFGLSSTLDIETERRLFRRNELFATDTHKSRCTDGANLVAREKMKAAAKAIRDMTQPSTELSSVARWCVEFRNDPLLARLAA